MSTRHPKWEERLAACIAENQDKAYDPSLHDCLMWPAKAVKAVTGQDLARGHRKKYKGVVDGYRHLRAMGFKSTESYLDNLFPEKPIGFAQRGDLILAADGIPGVVDSTGDYALSVGEGTAGLVRIPRTEWVKAWGVGEQHADVPEVKKKKGGKKK